MAKLTVFKLDQLLYEIFLRNSGFGCYGWSGESPKVLRERLTEAGFDVIEPEIKCNWNPQQDSFDKAVEIAKELCK